MSSFNETRLKLALVIAAVGTMISVIGWIIVFIAGDWGSNLVAVGATIGLVSYIFGGLLTAIRMTFDIATWSFVIAPLPYSLAIFLLTAAFALLTFFFLPIIPVYKSAKEHRVIKEKP